MKFHLTLEMNSKAFTQYDKPSGEAARILRELADRIDGHPYFSEGHSQALFDEDRNEVGGFLITGDEKDMIIYRPAKEKIVDI